MQTKKNESLNEIIYTKTLPSGLKCYIIPKKDYYEKQAMLCVKYGSIDNTFEVGGKKYDMPAGIAHFLEHKMFEDKDVNLFEEFSKLGADVNAFTNFNSTAYYFNAIENFDENLKLLADMVFKPYFTEENAEKEKGIIIQEIKMYEDDANWALYFNTLKGLYKNHPVRENIAGSVDSVNSIKAETLYDCYNTFYSPSNMAFICAGDFDEESAEKSVKIIEDKLSDYRKEKTPEITRVYGESEQNKADKDYAEAKMQIARPIFMLGFKDEIKSDADIAKKTAAAKILLDIIAGQSGELYNEMYNAGLTDANFSFDYACGKSYGESYFEGSSDNPEKVREMILDRIKKEKQNGVDKARFEVIKKKHIGRFIRGLNYIDAITAGMADYFAKDFDLLDMLAAYQNVRLEDINSRLNEHFKDDNFVLSVVK